MPLLDVSLHPIGLVGGAGECHANRVNIWEWESVKINGRCNEFIKYFWFYYFRFICINIYLFIKC
jgi:hypothetical protein